jgi:hypothetical protein
MMRDGVADVEEDRKEDHMLRNLSVFERYHPSPRSLRGSSVSTTAATASGNASSSSPEAAAQLKSSQESPFQALPLTGW